MTKGKCICMSSCFTCSAKGKKMTYYEKCPNCFGGNVCRQCGGQGNIIKTKSEHCRDCEGNI